MITHAQIFGSEKQKADQLPCGLFILKGENSKGLPTLRVWKPKAAHPHISFYYKSIENRDKAIDEVVARMENWIKLKEQRKIERKGKPTRTGVIKSALKKKFPSAKFIVNKGKGTASSWIDLAAEIVRPTDCYCSSLPESTCDACRRHFSDSKADIHQEVVLALKEHGMELSYYWPDDGYGDKRAKLLIQLSFFQPASK